MIYRVAVIERDAGDRIALEVRRLTEATPPANASVFELETDAAGSWERVEREALKQHRARMQSIRCGHHVDLRPVAEEIWRRCWAGHEGWSEAWNERLHLVQDRILGRHTLCGRQIAPGWYVVGDRGQPRSIAARLSPWADAGGLRCRRCEASWEAAMLAERVVLA